MQSFTLIYNNEMWSMWPTSSIKRWCFFSVGFCAFVSVPLFACATEYTQIEVCTHTQYYMTVVVRVLHQAHMWCTVHMRKTKWTTHTFAHLRPQSNTRSRRIEELRLVRTSVPHTTDSLQFKIQFSPIEATQLNVCRFPPSLARCSWHIRVFSCFVNIELARSSSIYSTHCK